MSDLKALILVGGFGTRLRPLTLTTSKPLVPFCNEPILSHQIKALASVGVNEIVLAVSYRAEEMAEALKGMEEEVSYYNRKRALLILANPFISSSSHLLSTLLPPLITVQGKDYH
jgi:NDP-sugar pyrophosphorylase family protein